MSKVKTVVVDEYGPDPLALTLLDEICAIDLAFPIEIDATYLSNPQLLAYDTLGDVELYFVILIYNGLCDSFQVSRGQKLNIPDPNQVKEILSRVEKRQTVTRMSI
jgi:hypothetical protein